jgi:hypothetical protein
MATTQDDQCRTSEACLSSSSRLFRISKGVTADALTSAINGASRISVSEPFDVAAETVKTRHEHHWA